MRQVNARRKRPEVVVTCFCHHSEASVEEGGGASRVAVKSQKVRCLSQRRRVHPDG